MFMAAVPDKVKNKVTAKLVSITDDAGVLLNGAENQDFHATRWFFQNHNLEDFWSFCVKPSSLTNITMQLLGLKSRPFCQA